MARQDGLIRLKGGIGNVSFYKTGEGYFARTKGGVSGKRFQTDPAFEGSRKSTVDFSSAARAGKLLRTAFRSLLHSMADNRVTARLNAAILEVILTDTINGHGQRDIVNGDLKLLEGFQFNKRSKLSKSFHAPFTASIDRDTHSLTVNIPAFIPAEMLTFPVGATHFRFKSGGASIDFGTNTYSVTTSQTLVLPIVETIQESLQLTQSVAPPSAHPLFLVFGIEFLQLVNGIEHPLNDRTCNAIAIVKVDSSRREKPL